MRTVHWHSPLCLLLLLVGSAPLPAGKVADRSPRVAAYQRFHAKSDPSSAAGRLLLTELSCTACHRPAADDSLAPKGGPVLDGIGERVSADWIRDFLASPHETKPGTTMPDVLAGLEPARRAQVIDDLTHLLASSTSSTPAAKEAKGKEPSAFVSEGRGKALFHEIGCAACHGAEPVRRGSPAAPAGLATSVPFPDLSRKYSIFSLADFLERPLQHRPAGRMPDLALRRQDALDIAAYLVGWTEIRTSGPRAFKPADADPNRAANAKALFSAIGCANCHTLAGTRPNAAAPALPSLANFNAGCLAPEPARGVPFYAPTDHQRSSIGLAVKSQPDRSKGRHNELMERFNCLACHERDGRGGPIRDLEQYFTGEADLGNEGRFPPSLTGVGRKLTPQWIAKVLSHGGQVRPYLRTRMPAFGNEALRNLPDGLVEADGGMKDPEGKSLAGGDVAAGRELMGTGGLSCITCHGLRGRPSIGIPAADLTTATERLQPEWFKRNLLEPAALRPGTLMPSFWPDGKAANTKILDGDTDRQIAAIWAYLRDGKELPAGYPPARGEFELAADRKAVLLRCFMKVAGTHAIAVGTPQKVHFAFDARSIRPALAWRGKFVDAHSTWFSRGQPPIEPLGEDVVALPATMPLARLSGPDAPWPAATGAEAGFRFGGYRLDKAGVPTFLYQFGATRIEDRISPAEDGKGLLRVIVLRGAAEGLAFDPGTAPGVSVRLLSPNGPASRGASRRAVQFDERGEARFTLEYQW
jgi:mono/diheme cytochrome c family protein